MMESKGYISGVTLYGGIEGPVHFHVVGKPNNYACGYLCMLGDGSYGFERVTCRECKETKEYKALRGQYV